MPEPDPIPSEPVKPRERLADDGRASLERRLRPTLTAEEQQALGGLIVSDSRAALQDREAWERMVAEDEDLYRGNLPEKTMPWPGCSNVFVPVVPTHVDTMRPRLVEAILGDDPPVMVRAVEPADEAKQDTTEAFLNWQILTELDIAPLVSHSAFLYLMPGIVVMKTTWLTDERASKAIRVYPADTPIEQIQRDIFGTDVPERTESTGQQAWRVTVTTARGIRRETRLELSFGETEIRALIEKTDVVADRPHPELIPPEDFIMPANAGGDVQRMPWCQHRMYLSEGDLRRAVQQGLFDQDAVEELIRGGPDGTDTNADSQEIREQRAAAQGVDRQGQSDAMAELYEVLEDYRRYDLDGDGQDEEIITWVATRRAQQPLGWDYLDNRFAHGRRPFRVGRYSEEPFKAYGDSLPRQLRDVQTEINAVHNQRIDAGTIKNALTFFYRKTSTMTGTMRVLPGEGIGVDGPPSQEVYIPAWPADITTGMNEEALLHQMAERRTGVTDVSLGRQPNRVGATRTATGTAALLSEAGLRFKAIMLGFQRFWRDVFSDILALDQQYLPPGKEFRVTGRWPERIKLTSREDIRGRFDLRLAMTSEGFNRAQQRDDAALIFQVVTNPVLIGTGRVALKGIDRATRKLLKAYGEPEPDLYLEPLRDQVVRTPEQELALMLAGETPEPSMAEDLGRHIQTHQMQLQGLANPEVRRQIANSAALEAALTAHLGKTIQMAQMYALAQSMAPRGAGAQIGQQATNAQTGRQAAQAPSGQAGAAAPPAGAPPGGTRQPGPAVQQAPAPLMANGR